MNGSGRGTKRHVLPQRIRMIIRIVGIGAALAVLVLAAGIIANIVASPRVLNPVSTNGKASAQAAADYQAGVQALSSGETTKGIELLLKSAAAGNTAARAKLQQVSGTATSTPSAVTSSTYTTAVDDLSVFLPGALEGFTLSDGEIGPGSAIVSGSPNDSGPKGEVSIIVVSVLDKSSVSGAAAWLGDFSKAYPKNPAAMQITDVAGKFGTDGTKLAAVAFVRGRYGFEIVATAVRGDPYQLKSVVLKAAQEVAASNPAE